MAQAGAVDVGRLQEWGSPGRLPEAGNRPASEPAHVPWREWAFVGHGQRSKEVRMQMLAYVKRSYPQWIVFGALVRSASSPDLDASSCALLVLAGIYSLVAGRAE